jgi:hypothetical protein
MEGLELIISSGTSELWLDMVMMMMMMRPTS